MIISGEKTIETRGYPLSEKYLGQELALIETPGPKGRKNGITESRIIGTVIFGQCFEYTSKTQWRNDWKAHLVDEDDKAFAFGNRDSTWGWKIESVNIFDNPSKPPKKRGIVYALNCRVPPSYDLE